VLPLAPERGSQADQRGDEDGGLAGFDLLHSARVEVGALGQSLLRQPARGLLPAHFRAKGLEQARFGRASITAIDGCLSLRTIRP